MTALTDGQHPALFACNKPPTLCFFVRVEPDATAQKNVPELTHWRFITDMSEWNERDNGVQNPTLCLSSPFPRLLGLGRA